MSFDDGLVTGLLLGRKLGGGGSEGGDDGTDEEWTYPSDWLPLPEPGAYEICLLVNVVNLTSPAITIRVSRPEDFNTGCGTLAADWGDGSTFLATDDDHWVQAAHKYESIGQYVARISCTDQSCFFQAISVNESYVQVLAAKLGDEIILNADRISGNTNSSIAPFAAKRCLQYVKWKGKEGLPRQGCFYACTNLREVDIDGPLKEIPANSFLSCYNLKNANFPECTSVGDYAFQYCHHLKNVDLPVCTSVGNGAFVQCYNLKEINLPECTSVGDTALYYCYNLKKIDLPVCTSLGASALSQCYHLKNVDLPVCTSVGNSAFYNCMDLREINIPECTSLGSYAFGYCYNLKELDLPVCTSVGDNAFCGCYNLRKATFAENCTYGTKAFYNCYSLNPRPDGSTA